MSKKEDKKRGRPVGSKTGSRPVTFYCAGIVDKKLVQEAITFEKEDEIKNASSITASARFKDIHGQDPEVISPPTREVKMKTAVKAEKKEKKSEKEIKIGTLHGKGVVKGWRGEAFNIENNSESYYFVPKERVKPSDKAKTPPSFYVVKKDTVEFA